jgi:hypothetical protein
MTSPDYRTICSGVLLFCRISLILALLHNIVSNYFSEPGRVACACFLTRAEVTVQLRAFLLTGIIQSLFLMSVSVDTRSLIEL